MSDIIYLKLVTGEELFAMVEKKSPEDMILNDVMIMETVGEPGDTVKYMFMSRYTPYTNNHKIRIGWDKIIYTSTVTDVVETHYRKSLSYAKNIADAKFMEGIADATSYIDMVLDKKENEELIEDQFVTESSSTKH